MLKAEHPNGKEYLGTEVPDLDLDVSDPHNIDWRCPIDRCELSFVDSNKRVKHFRHSGEYAHQSVAESPKHHYIKNKLRQHWNGENYVRNVAVEAVIGDQIADLLLVLKSGETIVVEIQLSPQSTDTFKERTRHYNERNFPVLWIVGQEKYIKPKSVGNSQPTVVYKDQIKWLQKQYFGRFYSVVVSDNSISIFPMRFERASAEKKKYKCAACGKPTGKKYCHHCGTEDTYETTYTKYYESAATFSDTELPNREPFVPEKSNEMDYEEFEIARFYDSKWWD